ncbi:flagellin [Pseudomonas sp. 10B1]|uniref:flagellin N-terminal helical domain-containing protein n=3 Tax=Pseudomonas TaxID=286 RepID=UPI002AB4DE11|nr:MULTISPECIES: flagellin [unclassified Pseudomonas]MDY7560754.1 flagellin [Pseudomonas sp. AB6]MEA9978126.1 flagellin [Pseudomonas sp. RTS4]MEB0087331.1 flagellin [Pseudomonas sp. RTI1]MEB0154601.1 flagellin [Pseudomonas sp. CCC4.3]MEB0181458.1 flagellin [Pseudomonas sp. CCC3.2]
MALTINTNTASLSVQNSLSQSSDSVNTTMSRLSSGLRINSAKDDAAGMQIASRLTTQIRGMTVAIRNAGNAISIAQTAEGAMDKSASQLQRMRELTIQSQNGNNGPKERIALNAEFKQNLEELTRASKSVTFGGDLNVMDGSAGTLTFQVGANAGSNEKISLSLSDDFSSESLFVAAKNVAGVQEDATTTGSKGIVAGEYTAFSIDGKGSRKTTGDDVLEAAVADKTKALDLLREELAALPIPPAPAVTPPGGTPPAPDPAAAAYEAKLAEVAAAQEEKNVADAALKVDLDKKKPLIDKAISDNLDSTLKAIDAALQKINSARAELGAKQNRLTSTISNLTNMVHNATFSRGQIQDVDYAAETAELTKQQILQQASTAILAQANQLPAAILKLLQ